MLGASSCSPPAAEEPAVAPRVYSDITARTLPFLKSVGVQGYYCEVHPYWAFNAPQLYLASRLLWDISLDPEQIMDRYMKRMFREVAGPMKKFYDYLEEVWRESTMPGRWFEGSGASVMPKRSSSCCIEQSLELRGGALHGTVPQFSVDDGGGGFQ